MGKLHNPHDQFFKVLLSDLGAARVYIQRFLPKNITELIDLSTLRITNHTFLSDEMSSQFADLIFECAIRTDSSIKLWISFLYEHKSTPDKYALLQVGHYLLGAYQKQIKERIKPMRLIVPILYYHGIEDWRPLEIRELLDHFPKHLKVFVPDYQHIFHDITLIPDEEIKDLENNLLIPGLLIQKYFKDLKRLQAHLEDIFYFLSLVGEEGNYKKNYFVYILDLFDEDERTFMKRIENMEPPTRDKTKNFILQLEQRGWAKGREEGREEAIKGLIRNKVSTDLICKAMDVSTQYVEKIKASM